MDEIKVGDVVARQGAWNRKYYVAHIMTDDSNPDYPQWEVTLIPIGDFYNDRPYTLSKRAKPRIVRTWTTPAFGYDRDNKFKSRYPEVKLG